MTENKNPYICRRLVRIDELGKILSVSTRTCENWVKARRISIIRVGGINLFDPDQVIHDLKQYEESAISPAVARRERIAHGESGWFKGQISFAFPDDSHQEAIRSFRKGLNLKILRG